MAIGILKRPSIVATDLFVWASEQGFIGVAVYVACWVFMFPVMVFICIAGAIFGWFIDEQDERDAIEQQRVLQANTPRDEAERQQWEEEDRRYEEAIVEMRSCQSESDDES